MLRGEVLAIGDEIVQGWSIDSNSGEVARELLSAGVRVARHGAVIDERGAIAAAIRESAARSDVLVLTGGLGPTEDDLTREGAADALGVTLEFVPELWEVIQSRWRARGRETPPSNRRQAERPGGSTTIPNANGTAPGFAFRVGACRAFALPGVPSEMRAMLADVVASVRREFPGAPAPIRRLIRCFGAPESVIGEKIAKWMARDADPLVGITVSGGVHTISVLASDAAAAERTAEEIAGVLGDLVVSRDGSTFEEAIGRRLLADGRTISFAESCTAGLAAARLASVAGISAVLRESFVVYSDDAKVERLGVRRETIAKHGNVSAECAAEMAAGAARVARTDLAASITGNAGPTG
ncbi:MAG TPA: nicotinamide-nucleotide amidohydrolase family protein, partial [Planctomycetota bacterium]|nr:nicotinamide-nucleotide amidohydrolase family protein [Planctomycetota bacterium]